MYNLWQLDINNDELKLQYRQYTKLLDKVIIDAKVKYDKKQIESNINNPKKLWEVINDKIGNKKSRDTINCIKTGDKKVTDKTEIANDMNSFFL